MKSELFVDKYGELITNLPYNPKFQGIIIGFKESNNNIYYYLTPNFNNY